MEINLNLPFKYRPGEELQFLEPVEVEEMRKYAESVATAIQAPGTTMDAALIRKGFVESAGIVFPVRTAWFFLRTAVEIKHRKLEAGRTTVEIPRRGPDKTRPGVWWGDLQDQMDSWPTSLEVSPQVAQWLCNIWEDDKVQNGFPPAVQGWMNVMDEEMARVSEQLRDSKSQVVKEER